MPTNFNQLDKWVEQVQSIPQVVSNATDEIKTNIDSAITSQLNAGQTPNGEAWKANKDGSKPLVGIKKYVSLTVTDSEIKATVSEPASYHQTGTDKLPKRQIIPEGSIPSTWSQAIKTALSKSWDKNFEK